MNEEVTATDYIKGLHDGKEIAYQQGFIDGIETLSTLLKTSYCKPIAYDNNTNEAGTITIPDFELNRITNGLKEKQNEG